MQYKIIVDKQSRTNPSNEKREYIIDIEELRFKGNVYDSLVITKDEDYVMRRMCLSEYNVLTELETPVKEPLENINIELFEGENYIYLIDMVGNKFYAEYIVKNDFTDLYVIESQMNSAINESARQIEISVNEKLINYSTTEKMNASISAKANEINQKVEKKVDEETITGAYLILKINGDTSEAKLSADKVELLAKNILNILSGNEINLTSNDITLSSTNFNVDKDGNVTISADEGNVQVISPTFTIKKDDGTYTSFYASLIRAFYNNYETMRIQPAFPMMFFRKYNEDTGNTDGTSIWSNLIRLEDGSNKTETRASGITTPIVTQTSLEAIKKNIQETQINALELIKNSNIYEYNLKSEQDTDKKRYGFVIGEKYNTPTEVISKDKQGIDTYSMSSIMWKALQQLIARVELLDQEVANGKN